MPDYDERLDRLKSLLVLEDGWLDGAGKAVTIEAAKSAVDILSYIDDHDLQQPSIFPTEDGGINLEWPHHSEMLSIEIMASGDRFEIFSLELENHESFLYTETDPRSVCEFLADSLA